MRSRRSLIALILAALTGVAPALAEELPTFRVVARNGRLVPDRLEVPAARRVKLVFENEGPGPEEFEIVELRVEKVLSPGARSFAVLPPLVPGRTVRLFGEFHPHTAECLITAK